MTLTAIREITTTIIAVLAFGLSLYNLYLQRHDKWPRMRVINPKFGWSNIVPYDDGGGGTNYAMGLALYVTLQNTGEKPIRIASISRCYGRFRHRCVPVTFHERDINTPLEPGAKRDLILNVGDSVDVPQGWVYVTVEDEIGHRYRSKKFFYRHGQNA